MYRPHVFVFILLLLTSYSFGKTGYFVGKLGDVQVISMMLQDESEKIAGHYRFINDEKPFYIKIVDSDWDKITIDGFDWKAEPNMPVGRITGQFNATHDFIGQWISSDKKQSLACNLHRVAELIRYSENCDRYSVVRRIPQFTTKSPFHRAINELLVHKIKDDFQTTIDEFNKSTMPSDVGPLPWVNEVNVDILYADDQIVSLLFETYEYTGGAHGNTTYVAENYTWTGHRIKKLNTNDFLSMNGRDEIVKLICKDLVRQNVGWSNDGETIKIKDAIINPTSKGLVFTFQPYAVDCYAAGTYTVMIPYKNISGTILKSSLLNRFVDRSLSK